MIPRVLRSRPPLVATILLSWGCSGTVLPPETEIDRDTFVRAYVDLRLAALETDGVITPAARDSILDAYGIDGEALVEFARLRGDDPGYMSEVWLEITQRMDGDTLDVDDDGESVDADGDGEQPAPGSFGRAGSP